MADDLYAVVDKSKKKSLSTEQVSETQFQASPPVPEYSQLYDTAEANEKHSNKVTTAVLEAEKPTTNKDSKTKKMFACFIIVIVIVATVTLACLVYLFFEIASIKTGMNDQPAQPTSITTTQLMVMNEVLKMQFETLIANATTEINSSIIMIVRELLLKQSANISKELITITSLLDMQNITFIEELQREQNENISSSIVELWDALNGKNEMYPASSCAALPPSSPAGYYWVRASNGSTIRVLCTLCDGVIGDWVKVADLNMKRSGESCPSGLTILESSNPLRTCVKQNTAAGCALMAYPYPPNDAGYSRMCGKIQGYQVGTTNGFANDMGRRRMVPNIDQNYVDGVTLTHGSPKQHIWTFASGIDKTGMSRVMSACPCQFDTAASPPAFVRNDYFCDTGTQNFTGQNGTSFFPSPLWDGASCIASDPCCSFNTPPWFHKQLSRPTTDTIEMRVCRDAAKTKEDIAIEIVEIYVD